MQGESVEAYRQRRLSEIEIECSRRRAEIEREYADKLAELAREKDRMVLRLNAETGIYTGAIDFTT